MLRGTICHALALMVLSASASMVVAAPAKKAVPKKPPAKRVVLGTKPLSGDQALPGQEFTLGKAYPMNFQLDRAEYSVARLRIGPADYLPKAEEKILLLHFTLHNPQPREARVRFDTFRFTAVDDTDTNREGSGAWGVTSTKQALNMLLKPGQKVAGYTYVVVPASATVPKLIVKAGDNTVLRYDLRGKIKPLTGPAVDPSGPAGAAALALVPATFGSSYQMGDLDVTIESAAYSTAALPGGPLREGERFFVVMASVRNAIQRPITVRFDSFRALATDTDGAEVAFRGNLLRASSDEPFNSRVTPDSNVRVRLYTRIARGVVLKDLRITSGNGLRTFVFDVSAVK